MEALQLLTVNGVNLSTRKWCICTNYNFWHIIKVLVTKSHLDTIFQLFFNLWTVVDCNPLTIALREEKFFTTLQLWAMSIQWLMTLPRPSAATPPRMVAMTTSETRLKCSMQERTVGALSISFGRWTYSRHWWSTTPRKRSYSCKKFKWYFIDDSLLLGWWKRMHDTVMASVQQDQDRIQPKHTSTVWSCSA